MPEQQVLPERDCALSIVRASSGRGFRLEASQYVSYPREQVFQFFSDAFKLQVLTPGWLHFHIVTPPPIDMQSGRLIDYRLRLHGIPVGWQSRISEWLPPERFTDEQTRGPYRRWRHEHAFEPAGEGTICRDVVDYDVFGGALVHSLFVRSNLLKIFAFRQVKLRELFPPTDSTPV
jgi:ligand-binding SRPBCC domain-containing protein